MKKSVKLINFFGIFIFYFVLLIVLFFILVTAQGNKYWVYLLWSINLHKIPIVLYLIVIAIVATTISLLINYFTKRSYLTPIEEKLDLLANGNFDKSTFGEITHLSSELTTMDNDLNTIQAQLEEMSIQLQCYSSQPEFVGDETKEEILEQERHRLARELHDSVSQQLFAASMMISALNQQISTMEVPEQFGKQLDTVGGIINASQSEMRALLLHLRPINLEGRSLQKGIEQLLKELTTKIQIKLEWNVEDVSLPKTMEDHLFRIVQELLSNTLRHAKANSLEVYLREVDYNVILRMVDDGVGFDASQPKMGSYGLNNIKERVASMGGTCRIISFKDQGTSVEIKIPLTKREGAR